MEGRREIAPRLYRDCTEIEPLADEWKAVAAPRSPIMQPARNPEGLKRAGAMTYREGDHRRALEYYERALAFDPEHGPSHAGLARL